MKIIIQGVANEGKSTVALMLERFLRDQGFTVTNTDENRYDGSTGTNHEVGAQRRGRLGLSRLAHQEPAD